MIENGNDLQDICRHALGSGCVALDTEFVWERTFYPRLGVVQIALSAGEVHLVDAVALPSLPGLGSVLACPDTQLLLHDAIQDLQILARHTGAAPRNVFDTRRAAGFAGLPSTASLSSLLQEVLGVNLPKSETRSNWLQRPLTGDQRRYAMDDVLHLHALRDALRERARLRGNGPALDEEMRLYDDASLYADTAPEQLYRRFNTTRWNDRQRSLLYTLVRWREEEARRHDRPRGHILQDKDLACIAQHTPRSGQDLDTIRGLSHTLTGPRRQVILGLASAAERLTPADLPALPPDERLTAAQKQQVAARQGALRETAARAGLDPALVATKADLVAITLHEHGAGPRPGERLVAGWRARVLAAAASPVPPGPAQQELPLLDGFSLSPSSAQSAG